MERLTAPRCSGIKSGYWSTAKKEELVQRLGQYEDTGLTPEEIKALQDFKNGKDGPATLSNRLNGKAPFPVDEIVVIGELLSISPDEIYGYFIKPWAIQAKKAKKNPAKSNRLVSFGA